MSGGFPMDMEVCAGQSIGLDTTTSKGVQATSGLSSGTLGTWVELIAATAGDITGFLLCLYRPGVGSMTVDIGIGASGSEVLIVNQAPAYIFDSFNDGFSYFFPIAIPAGTRVAARAVAQQFGGFTISVGMIGFDGGFSGARSFAGAELLGGAGATPNATAHTKGAFAELIAATTRDYAAIEIIQRTAQSFAGFGLVDLAIGGSGSEIVVVPNMPMNFNSFQNQTGGPSLHSVPMAIPAGTRLSTRCQVDQASGATLNTYVMGLYY